MKVVYEGDVPTLHRVLGSVHPGPNDVDPHKKAAAVAVCAADPAFRRLTPDEVRGGQVSRGDGSTWDPDRGWVPGRAPKTKKKSAAGDSQEDAVR